MKKTIQKFVALISCITITISISSRAYANSYELESKEKFGVAICSSDDDTIPIPNEPTIAYK